MRAFPLTSRLFSHSAASRSLQRNTLFPCRFQDTPHRSLPRLAPISSCYPKMAMYDTEWVALNIRNIFDCRDPRRHSRHPGILPNFFSAPPDARTCVRMPLSPSPSTWPSPQFQAALPKRILLLHCNRHHIACTQTPNRLDTTSLLPRYASPTKSSKQLSYAIKLPDSSEPSHNPNIRPPLLERPIIYPKNLLSARVRN
jgi:hypothetical protein